MNPHRNPEKTVWAVQQEPVPRVRHERTKGGGKQRERRDIGKEAQGLFQRAGDACPDCRYKRAEDLLALAIGQTVAKTLMTNADELPDLERAIAAAETGNWKEADRITGESLCALEQ